jgi:colicin import membrane protein
MRDISNKVQRNWRTPGNVAKGASCKVYVHQIPGGGIASVKVASCTGGSELFRRSVESAVYKSDPLPPPPDPAVFDREIEFTFTVES